MPSPNDTRIVPADSFADSLDVKWTISHDFAQRNGYNTTAHASEGLWHDGNVYMFGRNGHWWRLLTPSGNTWVDVGPTDPTLPPVIPPVPGGADTVLWDGLTGVTVNYFNRGALLPWEQSGGDWNDSAGANHGAAAFRTFSRANAVGAYTIDNLAALLQYMKTNNRRGIWINTSPGGYGGKIASRTHSDPTKRPFLTVNGSTVPCLASALINPSTSYPVYGTELQLSNVLILDFDIAAIPTSITSASLTLCMTVAPGTQIVSYKFFAARYPKIFNGGTPVLGIAAAYPDDVGIANHPDVYFSSPYLSATDCTNYFPDARFFSDITRPLHDDDLGRDCIQVKYQAGGHGTDGSHSNHSAYLQSPIHAWSRKSGLVTAPNGLPLRDAETVHDFNAVNAQTPTELYLRYYFWLAPNYQCDIEGKKMPALAGRYGWWSTVNGGYYQPVDGNGGATTQGTWKPASGTDPAYFSGWSNRWHHASSCYSIGGTAPNGQPGNSDPGNPYANLIACNSYSYWVGMPKSTLFRWGNSRPQMDETKFNPCGVAPNGFANLEHSRWYCVEHYVKMNDLTGTPDQYGNMTAVPNGIGRGWLNGVLMYEVMDKVWRKHPAIKIDEVWFDNYHGGTIDPETDHTFRLCGIVVAKSYIGPAAEPIVVPAPVAQFSGSPVSGTVPLTVAFADSSIGSVSSYAWDFGDGGTSTVASPSYAYSAAGTYTVGLTVTGPGGSNTQTRADYVSVTAPPVETLPAWLQGKPINTWIEIAGTKMASMAGAEMQKIVDAGLCGPAPNYASMQFPDGRHTGWPRGGLMTYSGACLKVDGSEMLLFGGGGAGGVSGDWCGNDVRGLRLEDDAPTWRIRTQPQTFAECYSHDGQPTPYDRPWIETDWTATPNQYCPPRQGHMYTHMFHDPATNRFWRTRTDYMTGWDQGRFSTMDSISLDSYGLQWSQCARLVHDAGLVDIPGDHPGSPIQPPVSGWTVQHPSSGHVYINRSNAVYRFDPSVIDSTTYPGYTVTGRWSAMGGPQHTAHPGHGAAALDTVRSILVHTHNVPRRAPAPSVPLQLLTMRLNAGGTAITSIAVASLVDGATASVADIGWTETFNPNLVAPSMIYDPGIDRFVYWQDDGKVYTFKWLSDSSYQVELLVGAIGTFPPIGGSKSNAGGGGTPHESGTWNRFQYVPHLKGICVIQHGNLNAFFVKTS